VSYQSRRKRALNGPATWLSGGRGAVPPPVEPSIRRSRNGSVPPRWGTMTRRRGQRAVSPEHTSRSAATVSSNGAPTTHARL
jgi:hypothetical protein